MENTSFIQMKLNGGANPCLMHWGVSTTAVVDQGRCPWNLRPFEKGRSKLSGGQRAAWVYVKLTK
jgi:hypothetical protein